MANIVTLTDSENHEVHFLINEAGVPGLSGAQTKGGLVPAGSEGAKVEKSFSAYFDPVRRLADQLAAKIDEVEAKPSEVEVTIGVKLTSEAGIIFAKAGADAEMTVKLVWKSTP